MRSLQEIKRLRKKYGLNQKELADKALVSQSLIAKIEAGKIEPSFSKAQQIFIALEQLRDKKELKAKEIMNKNVIFVSGEDSVKEVILLMKKKGISQFPVKCNHNICGLLTEKSIVENLLTRSLEHLKVKEIMEEAPPIIPLGTGLKMILELLNDYNVVLVAEKGDIKGILSKSDLFGKV